MRKVDLLFYTVLSEESVSVPNEIGKISDNVKIAIASNLGRLRGTLKVLRKGV